MLLPYFVLLLCLAFASAQLDCPEGCNADCKDKNPSCSEQWAGCSNSYWSEQCPMKCKKCVPCTEECKPSPTPSPESSGRRRRSSSPRRRSSRRRKSNNSRRRSPRRRQKEESRRRRRGGSRRRSPRRRQKDESRRRQKEESRRRQKEESPRRRRGKDEESRRRNKGGGGGGDGGGGGGGGMPAEPAYKCTPYSGSQFTGDVKKFVGNSNWCSCGYNENCAFICAGPGGGNCQGTTTCDDKTHSHDNKGTLGTWILNIKKDGGPFRAFGYMNKIKRSSFSPATTLSWTFKAVDHNVAYSKIFFWGDGANVLGLKPPTSSGGASQFCFFPSADAPLNQIQCKATAECKANTWYRIELDLKDSNSITFKINGEQIGSGSMNGDFSRERPMIGVYHWTGNGGPTLEKPYQLHFRDMCLGQAVLANR